MVVPHRRTGSDTRIRSDSRESVGAACSAMAQRVNGTLCCKVGRLIAAGAERKSPWVRSLRRRRCLPGWYGHGAQCRPCPPNTWKDSVTNADTCHPCPANSTRPGTEEWSRQARVEAVQNTRVSSHSLLVLDNQVF